MRPLHGLFATVTALALGAAGGAWAQGVPEIVARHGLRAVSPTPATDFTLPRLDGVEVSLSDYQGRWVLLTFFATWCGPCRSEMPSLEQLHRRSGDRLTVLAISVDHDRAVVPPFVDQLGISFPVLWDRGSKAASSYRASSIPLSYLVDPQGRIVAVAQGARDWIASASLFDELLATASPDPDAPASYASADVPVELPPGVEPPSADVALVGEPPVAGESFLLEVRLRWAGTLQDYLPLPPQVHLPEGVTRTGVSASSSSREGSNLVTYRLTLAAEKPGSYALDPVELRYIPRDQPAPLTTRLLGPTVAVRPATLLGLAPLALGLGAAGLAVLVAGALVLRRVVARRRPQPDGREERHRELRARFDAARANRLAGDAASFVLAMVELERELAGAEAEPDDEARRLAERARYGGSPPAAEALDRLQRRVERLLAAQVPDPDAAAREGLRLKTTSDTEEAR